MSERNLEQQIGIKFCVKNGKSSYETVVLVKMAYGKYAMKKVSIFEWHRQFKEGRKMCMIIQEVWIQTQKTDANVQSDEMFSCICLMEKTQTQADVDSPPWHCSCTWCITHLWASS